MSIHAAPKGVRLQIGLFGRTNVGKSSFLNMIAGQDVAITSPVAGTTTDVVEKIMELLPVGPVVFLDTAGMDDISVLSEQRLKKTERIFDRADVMVLLTEPGQWGDYEERIAREAAGRQTALIIVVNKIDTAPVGSSFLEQLRQTSEQILCVSCIEPQRREEFVHGFKELLIRVCPEDFLIPPSIVGDLLPPGGLAVLVVPIDLEAPKGRLILPQVQTIRDVLDNDAMVLTVKEREYAQVYQRLNRKPDIVVCDSQVVQKMMADTPDDVAATTFSILFARFKGDLTALARGAAVIDHLQSGDKVLIAEACSHHAIEDDIGRIKIPRWLKQYTGRRLEIHSCAGRDYPEELEQYRLVIHCGSCMLTRRETLARVERARQAGVAVTNYGICISLIQGVLKRALQPFPAAWSAYQNESQTQRGA